MTGWSLNGLDMRATYGFHGARPLVFGHAAARQGVVPVFERAGGFATAVQVEPVPLAVSGHLIHRTAAAREAAEDALLAALYLGEVTLDRTHPTGTVRRAVGVLDGVPEIEHLSALIARVRLRLLCPEPTWRATSETTVTMPDDTPVAWSIGTAPVAPVVTITGATNPSVVIRDSAAAAQITLVFGSLSVGADDLIIDCERGEIELDDGTPVRAIEELTSGIFPFRLLPAWGTGTVQVTSGTATMVYAKRYW